MFHRILPPLRAHAHASCLHLFLPVALLLTGPFVCVPAFAGPYADAVHSFDPAPGATFGHNRMPGVVLGPPYGRGELEGSMDVVSLGNGGEIVLEFYPEIIKNNAGPDFTVFENAFFLGQDPLNPFAETAIVSVSQDGATWHEFPADYNMSAILPANRWSGMAGVSPVLANPDLAIDPTDPEVSGGDRFDLDQLGLDWVRYVKLRDTGVPGTGSESHDRDGELIDDIGNAFPGPSIGFDLDSIVAIHYAVLAPTVTPTPVPTLTSTAPPQPTSTPIPPTATPTPAAAPAIALGGYLATDLAANRNGTVTLWAYCPDCSADIRPRLAYRGVSMNAPLTSGKDGEVYSLVLPDVALPTGRFLLELKLTGPGNKELESTWPYLNVP